MIKLKCRDGVVRSFTPAKLNRFRPSSEYDEAFCNECDAVFGVHDLSVLKEQFRDHCCLPRPLSAGILKGGQRI